jgi:hypothetical protein
VTVKLSDEAQVILKELRVNPLFKGAMRELLQARPVVPEYKPGQSQEENSSLLETIKYESGRKAGFDWMYFLLTGDKA